MKFKKYKIKIPKITCCFVIIIYPKKYILKEEFIRKILYFTILNFKQQKPKNCFFYFFQFAKTVGTSSLTNNKRKKHERKIYNINNNNIFPQFVIIKKITMILCSLLLFLKICVQMRNCIPECGRKNEFVIITMALPIIS